MNTPHDTPQEHTMSNHEAKIALAAHIDNLTDDLTRMMELLERVRRDIDESATESEYVSDFGHIFARATSGKALAAIIWEREGEIAALIDLLDSLLDSDM